MNTSSNLWHALAQKKFQKDTGTGMSKIELASGN